MIIEMIIKKAISVGVDLISFRGVNKLIPETANKAMKALYYCGSIGITTAVGNIVDENVDKEIVKFKKDFIFLKSKIDKKLDKVEKKK